MKFKICIEELVSDEFEIEATDAGEALDIAEEQYFKGKLVLEPGNLCSTQVAIIEPENEATEWVEIYPKYKFISRGKGKNADLV